MHWKFDPFFSIDILHEKYPPAGIGQAAPFAPDFSVEPTPETQKRLLKMGWVFKPRPEGGGGTLYAEKTIGPDGSAQLSARPATNEGFSFLLRLNRAAILSKTVPYDQPTANFPPFSGRARLLYFDNLNPVNIAPNTYFLMPGAAVALSDFASRNPSLFMFRATAAGATQVEMEALEPSHTSTLFPLNPKTKSVEIKLPENGYRATQKPVNQSEIYFLTDETLPADTLGILRIFQPPGADWEPFRRYQIFFDKVPPPVD